MSDLLVATRSVGKMREIRRILADVVGLRVLDLNDAGVPFDPAEDDLEPYDTFEANALSKAAYFHERSGLPTVADDSGIEIDALGGAPGVRSKRFAPEQGLEGRELDLANNAYMLQRLAGVDPAGRGARYVCVAALIDATGEPLLRRGESKGVIIDTARGDGGFGYDPHVLVPELGRTFAELSPAEKDARSHRGRAFRALVPDLIERLTHGS